MKPPVCFDCGHKLDDFTLADSTEPVPHEGAVGVCFYCGAFAVYTGRGLELRRPTEAELESMNRSEQLRSLRRLLGEARLP